MHADMVQGVTYLLVEPVDFISALAIAVCLTPTDLIVCSIIVGACVSLARRKTVMWTSRRQVGGETRPRGAAAYTLGGVSRERRDGVPVLEYFAVPCD